MSKQEIIAIVGGLSAGPSAAAKARRENPKAKIIVFEKGKRISYATCGLPYALSGKIPHKEKLDVVSPDLLRKRFGIDLHLEEEVLSIDPTSQSLTTSAGKYSYDKLIFTTGARPFWPPVEGLKGAVNVSMLRTLEDFQQITSSGKLKKVAVIGGGLIGLEATENLQHTGVEVTLVEAASQLLPILDEEFALHLEEAMTKGGAKILTNTTVTNVLKEGEKVTGLVLDSGERIATDYVIVSTGGIPNTELLTGLGAKALKNGALIVNTKMETSIPNVYAAGDCAAIDHLLTGDPGYFPLGTHSNKAGRTAGSNAAGSPEEFRGAYGSAIVKVFDFVYARTGMGDRELSQQKDFASILVVGTSTPGFYPDPKELVVKVHYRVSNGQLVGAQVMGQKGVDKRIDVLSTAIYGKLTIEDLPNLDLAYAPPFSPAKDLAIVAGFAAQNKQEKIHSAASPEEVLEGASLLDVRGPGEIKNLGKLKGALQLPLDEIEDRWQELDSTKPYAVYCARGLRGYLATVRLQQKGLQVCNLEGGFSIWKRWKKVEL